MSIPYRDPKAALDALFKVMKDAAQNKGYPLHDDCTKEFEKHNFEKFKAEFAKGKFKDAEPTLTLIAGLHGRFSAMLAKERNMNPVPVSIFKEVGEEIRKHCPASGRGDWCTWPP